MYSEVYSSSHVIIFVIDQTDVEGNLLKTYQLYQSLQDEFQTTDSIKSRSHILLFNKMDLYKETPENLVSTLKSIWADAPHCSSVSCLNGQGMEIFENELEKRVSQIVYGESSQSPSTDALITRQRHRSHLENCVSHLDAFLTCRLPMDLAAEELRSLTQFRIILIYLDFQ